MVLYLVQHGQAKTEADDPARPLSDEGVAAVERAARWLSRAGLEIAEIRHSGKRRAAQTAEILADHAAPAAEVRAVSGLSPNDDVRPVAEALQRDVGPVMLVGHLPFLGRLAGLLVAGDADSPVVQFTNAGLVCLARHDDGWRVDWALPGRLMG